MNNLIIETPRLRLRPLDAGDLDLALEMFTDPDVSRFVGETMSAETIHSNHPLWMRRSGKGAIGVWCVTDRESGEKLGTGALLPLPVDAEDTEWDLLNGDGIPDRMIEIGYILRKPAWGRGIATETCRSLLRFAFERTPLETVVACTHPDNATSQRVLRKCGLRDIGPIRAYAEDGIPGFEITKRDWLAAAG